MKQCPACQRTYTDDALSFCLEDGTPLQSIGTGSSQPPQSFGSDYDPNKTIAFAPPRDTSPPPANPQPVAPMSQPMPPQQQAWSPTPAYAPSVQPARKSGKGIIIIAIVAVIALGIGITVLLTVIGKNSSSNDNNNNNSNNSNSRVVTNNSNNSNNSNRVANTNTSTNTNRSTTSNVLKDDFSEENWPTGASAFNSFYEDGEYHMQAKPNIYIYMFPRNSTNYKSKDATVKVTARAVDGTSPDHGYGLIIHGKVNQNKHLEGYGFLIYSGSPAKYEIVRFDDGTPTQSVAWTTSNAIRGSTSSNQLEVRVQGSQLSFYINGQFINSVTDTHDITDGIVGLYTSDTEEIAYDDLEIDR